MKSKLIFISLLYIICGCSKSDKNLYDELTIDLITGIKFNEAANQELILGNPNTYVDNQFSITSNPSTNSLTITSQEPISDVFIMPGFAQKEYQNLNFSAVVNSDIYNEDIILSKSVIDLQGTSVTDVDIDISNLIFGYYRVFIRINGSFYWDNFYKLDDFIGENSQKESIIEYWNSEY